MGAGRPAIAIERSAVLRARKLEGYGGNCVSEPCGLVVSSANGTEDAMLGFHSDHAFGMRDMRPLRVRTSADAVRNSFFFVADRVPLRNSLRFRGQ